MERRRQPGRLDPPAASLRIREKQLVVITNLVRNAGPAKKVFQIRTAAECHRLAIFDVFTRGKTTRRRAATKPWFFLWEGFAYSVTSTRDRGAQSCKAGADHHYVWRRQRSGFE